LEIVQTKSEIDQSWGFVTVRALELKWQFMLQRLT